MSYDALIEQLRAAYDARAARDRAAARRAAVRVAGGGYGAVSRRRNRMRVPDGHGNHGMRQMG